MVLTCLPRVVQEKLLGKAELRSSAQRRHLAWLLTAILLGVGPKLKRVAHCSRGVRHRTSLGFFLNRSDWDEAGLLTAEAQRVLRRLRVRKGDVLDLILDDTRCVKRGRKMADISKLWDQAHQRFGHGHAVLTAAVHVRGVTLPWALRVWQPKKVAGAEYRKLTELAAEMISRFEPPRGVRVRVLFDAAYLCPHVTYACKERGFTWYSIAARNRRFWRLSRERTEKIEQFASGEGILT
jgi:SRSO17 transposase